MVGRWAEGKQKKSSTITFLVSHAESKFASRIPNPRLPSHPQNLLFRFLSLACLIDRSLRPFPKFCEIFSEILIDVVSADTGNNGRTTIAQQRHSDAL